MTMSTTRMLNVMKSSTSDLESSVEDLSTIVETAENQLSITPSLSEFDIESDVTEAISVNSDHPQKRLPSAPCPVPDIDLLKNFLNLDKNKDNTPT